MKRLLPIWILGLLLACSQEKTQELPGPNRPLTQYADPFIGTGGHGHTFPGATTPFGMVQLSPDTRLEGWDGCSGYHFTDSVIYGFSHTHLSGTGVSDYGDILFMPSASTPSLSSGYPEHTDTGYPSSFKKENESASPGFYEVTLEKGAVQVQLTASPRCGAHKYHFGSGNKGHVVIDLMHRDHVLDADLRIVNDHEIEGYRISKAWAEEQQVYFVARFSSPFTENVRMDSGATFGGKKAPIAALEFEELAQKPLEVFVGISAVDVDGARKNLDAETKGKNFDQIREEGEAQWERQLGMVEVKGGSQGQTRNFYTALYHSFIAPNLFSDVDGRYRGMDGKVHHLDKSPNYTVFSLWDTFRATHPLLTILEPERSKDFILTFLRQYLDGGRLPIWELAGNYTGCMIGYHAIPVIADAYVKGIQDFNADLALEAMQHSAELDWLGLDAYKDHGFISAGEEAESVSKTLEYAYDDWCIGILAEALGEKEIAAKYFARSENYIHLFDPDTKFFRARMNGGWQAPFDPKEVNFNFTEANAWQYSGFVPHNIHHLIALHGGPSAFATHLDSLFTTSAQTTGREQADITGLIGQYAHGNEPSHHMAYLYAYAGQASKGQNRVRQIMDELYRDQPDGLSGNEDCGQMSSWYVFSALGFYPVTPGTDQYVIGSPLFPEAEVKLPNGNQFTILAPKVSPENRYIQSAKLNGEELHRAYIRHTEITSGGILEFEMGPEPNDTWFSELPGLDTKAQGIAAPVVSADGQTFVDSLAVELTCASTADILYSLDGSDPLKGLKYDGNPISLHQTTLLKAVALGKQGHPSPVVTAELFKIEGGRSIKLASTYANQYAAGGNDALIDHLRGGPNFRTGRWQGYRENFEGTVDLGAERTIHEVEVGFLQDIKSWIWMPREVEIAVSVNENSWQVLEKGGLGIPDDAYGAFLGKFEWKGSVNARFLRVKAKQYGVCPPWHLGAGGKSWIFMDEISIQ